MAITTTLKSESRPKAGTISLVIVAGMLRILDVAMIMATAQLIRPAFNEHDGVEPYYGVATVLAALLAVIIFHLSGLYRLKGLSFRTLRDELEQGGPYRFDRAVFRLDPAKKSPGTSQCAFPS